jgi:predicted outer membrane repeat protein
MKRIITLTKILVVFTLLVVTSWNIASARGVGTPAQAPTLTILYVKLGGGGGCASWGDACELQAALAAANSGTEIWVQAGVYKPTPGIDRATTFSLKSGVALYGGFAGTETERNQRNWVSNVTTLSGDIGAAGDNSDNSYHVVSGSGVDGTAILDGFTITAGNANGGSYADYGGGMYNNAGSPTVKNIIFSANLAVYGGGMLNHTSHPVLNNLTFSGNNAGQNGGGMYNYLSNPALTEITFTGNIAILNGGGLSNTGSSPVLSNVTFSDNAATYGGGMYSYESSPTLDTVTFSANNASQDGGGMHSYTGSITLTNVTFSDNTADQYGGGMYNYTSSPTLTDVTFSSNVAAARGGGIYNYSGSDPSLTNIIFSGNSATEYGGGMFNYVSGPMLVNIAFSGNFANLSGGGMYNYMDNPTLTNVTFSANSAPTGGGIYNNESSPPVTSTILWGNTPDQMVNGGSSAPVVSYSDIQGGCPSGATCTQVVSLNPQFTRSPSPGTDATWGTADDDYGDLRLQITSPANDAGDNTAVPVGVVTDLGGNARFVDVLSVPDTGNGTAPIVDMGAYETQPETIPPTVVSILRVNPSLTNAASVNYTVTFSEAVTGVGVSDFTLTLSGVTGAAITGVSGGPTSYNVAASTGTGSGTLRLDIPATASITDLIGNPLSGLPYTSGESYTIDRAAPTVVSTLRANPSPTNAASVSYTVTFSEAVTGVGVVDFSLTLTGVTGATVTGVSGGPTTYTVAVSTGTGSGTLRLDIPDTASITDTVGSPLSGLPYTAGESYTIDRAAPTVVSILRADPNPTNADNVDYTVTFSEDVTGVGLSDFSLTISGITDASVTGVSGGPITYTVSIDTGRRNGTLRLDIPISATITDGLGNPLAGLPYTAGESYTIDRDEPTMVSILRADPSPTNATSVDYTVTFSEAVTGVGISDFTLTLSGISGAAVTGVSEGTTIYTVSVSTGTGSGTLRLDVPGTALITDEESYTIDKIAPTVVSILRADPNPTNAASVSFIVTFSEAVSGVDTGDFSVFTSGTISGSSVTNVSGTGVSYTVTVNTGTGSGTLRLDIPGTVTVSDLVGNPLSGIPYASGEVYAILWKIYLSALIKATP